MFVVLISAYSVKANIMRNELTISAKGRIYVTYF